MLIKYSQKIETQMQESLIELYTVNSELQAIKFSCIGNPILDFLVLPYKIKGLINTEIRKLSV